MPELPEVETTKRGIEPHISKKQINSIYVSEYDLRIKFNKREKHNILNTRIESVRRRAKYILIDFANNYSLLIHLGMTGNLRIADTLSLGKHDHIALSLNSKKHLIYNDVRRFGVVLIIKRDQKNKLLENNGPDPFENKVDYRYLYKDTYYHLNRNLFVRVKIFYCLLLLP